MIPADPGTSPETALRAARIRPRVEDMVRVDARAILRALGDPAPAFLAVGDASFSVVRTPADFGGRLPGRSRPWVLCRCGRRVAVLYAVPDSPRFACRRCWALRYASDGMRPETRRRRHAWLLRAYLGEAVDAFEDFAAGGFRPVPPRPRAMPLATYARLVAELAELEGAEPGAARAGRPKGMSRRKYEATLDRMARSPDTAALEAAIANFSRARLVLRRGRGD